MDEKTREFTLIRANLLCRKGKFETAERLLTALTRDFPGDKEAWYVLERIRQTKNIESVHEGRLRTVRHMLRMHTSWNRFCYWIGSLVTIAFAIHFLIADIIQGRQIGFLTMVTTVSQGKGGPTYYTRPLWTDMIWCNVALVLAIACMITLVLVSRGAAQWEELTQDADHSQFMTRY